MIIFLILLVLALTVRYLWCLSKPPMLLELWRINHNIPHRLRVVVKEYLIWFPLLKPVTIGCSLLHTKAPYTGGERWAMIGLEVLMLGATLLVLTPLEALGMPARLYTWVSSYTYGFLRQWFEDIASSAKITNWQERSSQED